MPVILVKHLRAGDLTAIWVPDPRHEAMRDLTRVRPHLCTIITSTAPSQIVEEDVELWRPRLTRDIRANDAYRGALSWKP
jgi:hypothetical protein